jgi:HAMP domain-containing protein
MGMTWIAACSGQRGIYQEVTMTDEERQKLCKTLLAWASTPQLTDRPGSLSLLGDFIREAVDEIERLAAELKQVESENEHHIRLAFVDAGANPARTWKEATDEERQKLVARLRAHEVFMWTDIDLAADEIERLAAEVEEWKQAAEVSIDEDAVDAAFEQWMKTREPRHMGLQRGAFHAGVKFGLRHAQSNAEPKPDDWLYSASECAREVLNYLGEGSVASMEPGMDRRRDNVAKIINRYLDKPPALAQSDAEPDPNFDPVEAAEVDAKSIEAANAQFDAEPQETWNKQLPGPDSTLHELGECPDASVGLIEAAEELADLMDDVVRGNYKPDSFTTQPLRKALHAYAGPTSEPLAND